MGMQLVNGSPVYWDGQLQMGLWLRTVHRALGAHELAQGFWQRWFTQARVCSQSELVEHSGLQLGGWPKYPWAQEQEACEPNSRHTLFGPQGDGEHGLGSSAGSEVGCNDFFSLEFFHSLVGGFAGCVFNIRGKMDEE